VISVDCLVGIQINELGAWDTKMGVVLWYLDELCFLLADLHNNNHHNMFKIFNEREEENMSDTI